MRSLATECKPSEGRDWLGPLCDLLYSGQDFVKSRHIVNVW